MIISVIIPALNEATSMARLVRFIRDHGKDAVAEIIVVDGGSEDDTIAQAESENAVVLVSKVKSRAAQMNLGAAQAKGEVLYFVHADIKPVSSFVEDIHQAIHEGFPAGCYRYVFDSPKVMLKINAWFTRFNSLMCRGGDQTLFITRQLFTELGRFNEYYTIMEDFELIQRIWKKVKFKIIPKEVVVSARKYDTNSWLRVQIANLTVFMMFRFKASPERMKRTYKKMLDYR